MMAVNSTPSRLVLRAGNAVDVIDAYAARRRKRPGVRLRRLGGAFNNDTECVNGPRRIGRPPDQGRRSVHEADFGVSNDPANWGVVGWSMGGTCALDLTAMHPRPVQLVRRHRRRPGANARHQTVASRACSVQHAAAWTYDHRHHQNGRYQRFSGWFAVNSSPERSRLGHATSRSRTPSERIGLPGGRRQTQRPDHRSEHVVRTGEIWPTASGAPSSPQPGKQ